jgi:hypothetical protein
MISTSESVKNRPQPSFAPRPFIAQQQTLKLASRAGRAVNERTSVAR